MGLRIQRHLNPACILLLTVACMLACIFLVPVEYVTRCDRSTPQDQQQLSTTPLLHCCTLGKTPVWKPQNGATFEDSEVAGLVESLSRNGNLKGSTKYAVDFGANDGRGPSETIFTGLKYPGLVVEGDGSYLGRLKTRFPSQDITKTISYITPQNAVELLQQANAPKDMHYFKIDMDADDCATLVAVLHAGYRPRIIQAELTYEIPYPYAFGVYALSK